MTIRSTIQQGAFALLLFAGLLSGTTSCKKDKDENSTPPPAQAERIREFKTGEEFVRFDYSAAGGVEKVIIKTDANTGGATLTYAVTYGPE